MNAENVVTWGELKEMLEGTNDSLPIFINLGEVEVKLAPVPYVDDERIVLFHE